MYGCILSGERGVPGIVYNPTGISCKYLGGVKLNVEGDDVGSDSIP